ncbi:hypothetical protein [Pedosphaera parvula]|uniref:Uncharacterized protein n=1 Tax=Pedosphaera parvula (strain Ellin514) TaxID=320771 RepID=B9XI51_PEDPL|nr:hypothetical protein [Pedosphaera parvula]EEF60544.1 hypothetical protein Cflav_PD3514 [Pedosphaera parvula Ellin514]
MPYAVVQKDLEAPAIERLKAAFRNVPGLTAIDAQTVGNDAFGILVKGFTLENANRLNQALQAQGVETEVVEESMLPTLPPGPNTTFVDCTPEQLVVYDSLNRPVQVDWQSVVLIAAGKVPLIEFNKIRVETPASPFDPANFGREYEYQPRTNTEYETREERQHHLLLEIILEGGISRYGIDAGKSAHLLFRYLGERKTRDLQANFTLLIQDLASFAPHAAVNRGTYYFRERAAQPFFYPSKNAFYEEIIWLLWKLSQKQPPGY